MKLLVDMNLSPRWALFLAASKVEAVHWSNVGAVTAPDTEIMAYAREHGYIVLTRDLDFSAILAATGGTKPSVMQIRSENLNPDVVGEKIVSALWQMQVQLEAGAVVRNNSIKHQAIKLPLARRNIRGAGRPGSA